MIPAGINEILSVGTSLFFLETMQVRETTTTTNEPGGIDKGRSIVCAGISVEL